MTPVRLPFHLTRAVLWRTLVVVRGRGKGTKMVTLAESGYWVDHWWFPLVLLLCSPLLLVVGCAYFIFCEKIDKYRSGP